LFKAGIFKQTVDEKAMSLVMVMVLAYEVKTKIYLPYV
jgi:hypothetical protein